MAKKTAEKAPQQEPELIIPVDEFNRDKLGEHVARQISSFIGRKARRFGMPLHDTETLQEASKCLDGYFREVSGENLGSDVRRVICSVRLSLYRYDKSQGIELISVSIEPRDKKAKTVLVQGKDERVPALDVVGPRFNSRPYTLNMVDMTSVISSGAQQIQVLSDNFRARSFAIGEQIPEQQNTSELLVVGSWKRGAKVTIPAGATMAFSVPVSDHKKLDKHGIPYFDVGVITNLSQGVYLKRFLTKEAVMDLLK